MYGDGSSIRRRVRARQQDLTTECDGLLMQDELKLVNKLLDVTSKAGRGISYDWVGCFLPGHAEHFNSWGCSKFTQLWL
jgi:hypothetical protein